MRIRRSELYKKFFHSTEETYTLDLKIFGTREELTKILETIINSS